jgi:LiaF transmembrane domain
MPIDRRSVFPGILLIILGLVFLLPNFLDVRVGDLWPAFLLGPGLIFFFMFSRDRKNYGLLMPATILTVMGLMFFALTLRMTSMDTIWPLFIISPGLGLFLMYLLGKREKGLLIPAGILICVGLVFLIGASHYSYLWPAVLIAIGIIFLFNAKR